MRKAPAGKVKAIDESLLPELPLGWSWAKLVDLAAPEPNSITDGPFGSNLKTSHYTERGPRVIRLQNVGNGYFVDEYAHISEQHFETLSKHHIHAGDLAIAALGETLPRSCIIPAWVGPALVKADCPRFKPNRALVSPEYVNFALNSPQTRNRTSSIIHGVGRPRLNLSEIRGTWIPLAPVGEQSRIVAKIEELFSDLDAGVAALERVRANLKRYRASLLKAAVEGRLTEQWRLRNPPAEPASQLLQRILEQRRRMWEEEKLAQYEAKGKKPPKNWREKYKEPAAPDVRNLPELPEGWCWATVEQLGDVQLGRQRSPKHRSKDYPTPYLRAANITEDGLDLTDLLEMEFRPHEIGIYRLSEGDLVFSEASGSPDQVGKPAIWNNELHTCCFQNTVIRLRPVVVSSRFMLVVFKHCYFNKVFSRVAAGVGINHLSAARFSQIVVPLAPLAEQGEIVDKVDQMQSVLSQVDALVKANGRRPEGLRQAILKRAFQGELVPQNPNDEPADVLLERIRAQRSTQPKPTRKRKPASRQLSIPFQEPR